MSGIRSCFETALNDWKQTLTTTTSLQNKSEILDKVPYTSVNGPLEWYLQTRFFELLLPSERLCSSCLAKDCAHKSPYRLFISKIVLPTPFFVAVNDFYSCVSWCLNS
eukprot:4414995-Amphidinium_carterae.2